ncbi:MAG: protein-L-isoaspartate O-methyltransferase family protein [Rhodocyclaceae bacterium]
MNFELARHHMIEQQLRPWCITDPEVIEQLYADRREDFVPEAYRALAFADVEIPLGHGATMLRPVLEGRILQALAGVPLRRVLEVGTGSGHMASLLAQRAQEVWTIEIEPALAEMARANLERAEIDNVHVETGDGLAGLRDHVPYDAIVLSGGVREIPQALLDQLADGGRLVAFVPLSGKEPLMAMRVLKRNAADAMSSEDVLETIVPMLKQPAVNGFVF